MVPSFFQAKRPWSKYKDFLLRSYIEPYIPKVASLKKPIVIVDCFAGRGRFEDGEDGSPLIIASAIQRWRAKGVDVSGEFIEADPDNYEALCDILGPHTDYCTPRPGMFDENLPELARRAQRSTVFLYVDPYTVKGLIFEHMKRVYDQIRQQSSSVEVLLNLNVAIFMRWALAALNRRSDLPHDSGDVEGQADDPCESVEIQLLHDIAGGDYWIPIASDDRRSFAQKLTAFLDEYTRRMLGSFRYACTFWVKDKYHHQVPKYVLVYATRSSHGVELMNDFMCQARRDFLAKSFSQGRLFDCTPDDEAVDPKSLGTDIVSILTNADGPLSRKDVRMQLMLRYSYFGKVLNKEVNARITDLLKDKSLFSKTGRVRINDEVLLSHQSF